MDALHVVLHILTYCHLRISTGWEMPVESEIMPFCSSDPEQKVTDYCLSEVYKLRLWIQGA